MGSMELRPVGCDVTVAQTISGRTGGFGLHAAPSSLVQSKKFISNLEKRFLTVVNVAATFGQWLLADGGQDAAVKSFTAKSLAAKGSKSDMQQGFELDRPTPLAV